MFWEQPPRDVIWKKLFLKFTFKGRGISSYVTSSLAVLSVAHSAPWQKSMIDLLALTANGFKPLTNFAKTPS